MHSPSRLPRAWCRRLWPRWRAARHEGARAPPSRARRCPRLRRFETERRQRRCASSCGRRAGRSAGGAKGFSGVATRQTAAKAPGAARPGPVSAVGTHQRQRWAARSDGQPAALPKHGVDATYTMSVRADVFIAKTERWVSCVAFSSVIHASRVRTDQSWPSMRSPGKGADSIVIGEAVLKQRNRDARIEARQGGGGHVEKSSARGRARVVGELPTTKDALQTHAIAVGHVPGVSVMTTRPPSLRCHIGCCSYGRVTLTVLGPAAWVTRKAGAGDR